MKLTDILVSAIVKKGVLYEARNVSTNVLVPMMVGEQEKQISIEIKIDHMTLKVDKDEVEN